MTDILDEEQAKNLLLEACKREGSRAAWGKKHGFSSPHITVMISGGPKNPVTIRACKVLGLERFKQNGKHYYKVIGQHEWHDFTFHDLTFTSCKKCGILRRLDEDGNTLNKLCPGKVTTTLRDLKELKELNELL